MYLWAADKKGQLYALQLQLSAGVYSMLNPNTYKITNFNSLTDGSHYTYLVYMLNSLLAFPGTNYVVATSSNVFAIIRFAFNAPSLFYTQPIKVLSGGINMQETFHMDAVYGLGTIFLCASKSTGLMRYSYTDMGNPMDRPGTFRILGLSCGTTTCIALRDNTARAALLMQFNPLLTAFTYT
jgi:hypothetical protein